MAYKDSEKYRQWLENNKERLKQKRKEYMKAWKESHKEQYKATMKAWKDLHREEEKAKVKAWQDSHKKELKAYNKADINSLGQTKNSIRSKSNNYLKKYGNKISGYEIHHCFTYNEPYKFIYCPRKLHRLIHSYLKQHNIDADTEHYEYIKHLLDDTVIKYNID